MQIYTYTYEPSNFKSFFELLLDTLLETPMDNNIAAQDEQTEATETDLQIYPLQIKVAGKLALLHPNKRPDLGYECRTAIDNAVGEGFVGGSLILKHNLTDSMSSLGFMRDLDNLRWDTLYMEITGPQKAFEIIRNMGYTKLACGDKVEDNCYMCQITNIYTDVTAPESNEVID